MSGQRDTNGYRHLMRVRLGSHGPTGKLLHCERNSIQSSKRCQACERIQAARQVAQELGIPIQLIELYDAFGFEQMHRWTHLLSVMHS